METKPQKSPDKSLLTILAAWVYPLLGVFALVFIVVTCIQTVYHDSTKRSDGIFIIPSDAAIIVASIITAVSFIGLIISVMAPHQHSEQRQRWIIHAIFIGISLFGSAIGLTICFFFSKQQIGILIVMGSVAILIVGEGAMNFMLFFLIPAMSRRVRILADVSTSKRNKSV